MHANTVIIDNELKEINRRSRMSATLTFKDIVLLFYDMGIPITLENIARVFLREDEYTDFLLFMERQNKKI